VLDLASGPQGTTLTLRLPAVAAGALQPDTPSRV